MSYSEILEKRETLIRLSGHICEGEFREDRDERDHAADTERLELDLRVGIARKRVSLFEDIASRPPSADHPSSVMARHSGVVPTYVAPQIAVIDAGVAARMCGDLGCPSPPQYAVETSRD